MPELNADQLEHTTLAEKELMQVAKVELSLTLKP